MPIDSIPQTPFNFSLPWFTVVSPGQSWTTALGGFQPVNAGVNDQTQLNPFKAYQELFRSSPLAQREMYRFSDMLP